MLSNRALIGVAAAAGAAGAIGTVGVGTIVGGLVRAALAIDPPIDDGPEPLLARPTVVPERLSVRASDGTPINTLAYGPPDGDLMVFAHGWACSTMNWWAQINAFASTHRVVVYDQRGHGDTPMGRSAPSPELLGRDLESVLSQVVPEGKRALIGGHSMGGMSIISWAKEFPASVDRYARVVVLTSTAATEMLQNLAVVPEGLPRFTRPFEHAVSRIIAATPAPLPHTALSPRVSQYIALNTRARLSQVEFCERMISASRPIPRARWGVALLKISMWQGVLNLRVPTAVVVGTDDRLTPKSHSDAIAAALEQADNLVEYVVFAHTGHMANIEEADEYNALLAKLLQRTDQRAAT